MKSNVMIPKNAYEGLLKKAQTFERFRQLFQEEYPLELYSDKRIKEFKKEDKISLKLKKSIGALLKNSA